MIIYILCEHIKALFLLKQEYYLNNNIVLITLDSENKKSIIIGRLLFIIYGALPNYIYDKIYFKIKRIQKNNTS